MKPFFSYAMLLSTKSPTVFIKSQVTYHQKVMKAHSNYK